MPAEAPVPAHRLDQVVTVADIIEESARRPGPSSQHRQALAGVIAP